jgi:hypothetical protein
MVVTPKRIIRSQYQISESASDSNNGYTVMRNLNGDTMRGYIQKDASGLLRDQNGNFYNVHTRW